MYVPIFLLINLVSTYWFFKIGPAIISLRKPS